VKRRLAYWLVLLLPATATNVLAATRTACVLSIPPAAVWFAEGQTPGAPGGHETLFDLINLIILIAVLVYLLRKPVAQFFYQRSQQIRKALEEGRQALDSAQSKLRAAEEKMLQLEQEIAALKEAAMREMASERERMHEAAEAETERILASAQSTIETATQRAKLELKKHAALQACELAAKMVQEQLNPERQARLVGSFIEGLPQTTERGKGN
jgi:F-type H+-transporting ATPase subunit b